MEKNHENRQTEYHQKFSADSKTLALCSERSDGAPELCTSVGARIRITKEDRRLPLFFVVAFEPEGGSPDDAEIVVTGTPTIIVTELQLMNRSYVPIVRDLGNPRAGGVVAFPSRKGTLGICCEVHADCDAVDITLNLLPALGGFKHNQSGPRWGGRWSATYSMTCNDRLSREEWTTAVQQTNMRVEITRAGIPGTTTPTPVLTPVTGEQ
jgi:hypothetical protein